MVAFTAEPLTNILTFNRLSVAIADNKATKEISIIPNDLNTIPPIAKPLPFRPFFSLDIDTNVITPKIKADIEK